MNGLEWVDDLWDLPVIFKTLARKSFKMVVGTSVVVSAGRRGCFH
jgi:hypothetical protein